MELLKYRSCVHEKEAAARLSYCLGQTFIDVIILLFHLAFVSFNVLVSAVLVYSHPGERCINRRLPFVSDICTDWLLCAAPGLPALPMSFHRFFPVRTLSCATHLCR